MLYSFFCKPLINELLKKEKRREPFQFAFFFDHPKKIFLYSKQNYFYLSVMVSSCVIALDYDYTISTGSPLAMKNLREMCKRNRVPIYLNTARPPEYCKSPNKLTTSLTGTSKKRLHCLVNDDPPTSKVLNMKRIAKLEKMDKKDYHRLVLVDDRPENIDAVKKKGFSGIKVKARSGIDYNTLTQLEAFVEKQSLRTPKHLYRGCGVGRRKTYLKIALVIIAILCVLLAMLL